MHRPTVRVCSLIALAAGCGGPRATDVQFTVSENIATVVTVDWNVTEEVEAYVEFGHDEAFDLQTPLQSGDSQSVSLLGLLPESAAQFRIVIPLDDGDVVSDTYEVTTGPLSNAFPTLEGSGSTDAGGWMLVPMIGSTTGPVILNPDGNIVWAWSEESDLDVYRVRVSQDGQSVLYNAASVSGDPADDAMIIRVALDGSSVEEIPVSLLAHDFVEFSDGSIGAMIVEYDDTGEIRGDALVEIGTDGSQELVWSAWDCFDPEVNDPGESSGWTFANALDYDADEDAYYLGMRNFSGIIKIPRSDYSCEWVFGGEANTFDFTSGSGTFLHQHQFEVLDDSILVFDNDGYGGAKSRAIEYTVDFDAQTADETWSYVPTDTLYSFVLGDVGRLAGGDTIITWSVAGQIDRIGANGNVKWSINTGVGAAFGFNNIVDSPYP